MENYSVKQATYRFECPACGHVVPTGENYVIQDGTMFCMCRLETKNLVPVEASGTHTASIFKKNSAGFENLKMRIELETIAADPDGKAAMKILAKYRRRMKEREERLLSTQN